LSAEPSDEELPALIVYTSGTTGPAQGRGARAPVDRQQPGRLAVAWEWTERDTVVHALPLFHVHGLILA